MSMQDQYDEDDDRARMVFSLIAAVLGGLILAGMTYFKL